MSLSRKTQAGVDGAVGRHVLGVHAAHAARTGQGRQGAALARARLLRLARLHPPAVSSQAPGAQWSPRLVMHPLELPKSVGEETFMERERERALSLDISLTCEIVPKAALALRAARLRTGAHQRPTTRLGANF